MGRGRDWFSPPPDQKERELATDEDRAQLRELLAGLRHPIIMDVGSGGAPLPIAHILVDKYPDAPTVHRNTECFGYPGQIFVRADVEDLPFDDGAVDFIWCSHVLEHVDNPVKAIAEMRRVSPRGAILIPPAEMEAMCQMDRGGEKAKGHQWLCRKEPGGGLVFLRCDTANKDEVRGLLSTLGCWPQVPRRLYEIAIFQGWGWNGWPDTLEVTVEEPTPEVLAEWYVRWRMNEGRNSG